MTFAVYLPFRKDGMWRQLDGGCGFPSIAAARRWLEMHGGEWLPCEESRSFPGFEAAMVRRGGVWFAIYPE